MSADPGQLSVSIKGLTNGWEEGFADYKALALPPGEKPALLSIAPGVGCASQLRAPQPRGRVLTQEPQKHDRKQAFRD